MTNSKFLDSVKLLQYFFCFCITFRWEETHEKLEDQTEYFELSGSPEQGLFLYSSRIKFRVSNSKLFLAFTQYML